MSTERLIFLLEAQTKRFENAMAQADKKAERNFKNIEKRAEIMEQRTRLSLEKLSKSMSKSGDIARDLRNYISLAAITAAGVSIKNLADSYTALQNQMGLYTDTAEAAQGATQFVIDAAVRARVPLSELTSVYAAAARAQKNLGIGQLEIEALVEATGTAAALAARSSSGMSGALLQFSQAIGGASVQAEEFNSILDGTPALALALARGIEEAEGSVANLQRLVRDGKIAPTQFVEALIKGLPEIRAEMERTTPLIEQSLESMKTRLTEYVGKSDDAIQATEGFARMVAYAADNIEVFGDAAVVFVAEFAKVLGLAAPLGLLVVGIMNLTKAMRAAAAASAVMGIAATPVGFFSAAIGTATASLVALRAAALAFIATPLGIAVTAVAVALGYAAIRSMEAAKAAALLVEEQERQDKITQQLKDNLVQMTFAEGEQQKALRAQIEATRDTIQAEADRLNGLYETKKALLELAETQLAAAIAAETEAKSRVKFMPSTYGGMPLPAYENRTTAGKKKEQANKEIEALTAELSTIEKERQLAETRLSMIKQTLDRGSYAPKKPPTERGGSKTEAGKAEREALRLKKEAQAVETRELEMALELAKAREENADALEDQIAVRRLAASLDKEGLITEQSRAQAEKHVLELRKYTNAERARELASTQRQYEIETALLEKDWSRARLLEEAAKLEEMVSRLRAFGLSDAEALARAEAQIQRQRSASLRLAENEARLDLEREEISRLRAQGYAKEAQDREDALELAELTERYERAGVEHAAEKAKALVAVLESTREIEASEARQNEARAMEIELLKLRGLDRLAEQKERQARELERTRELQSQGRTVDQARDEAYKEMSQQDAARLEGQVRDAWRSAIRAAFDNSFESYLSNLLSRVMDRAADALADVLFDVLRGASSGLVSRVFGKRDGGGPVSAGRPVIVGEHGPEIFNPASAGYITSRSRTADILSGASSGAPVIHVYANNAVLANQIYQDIARAMSLAVQSSPSYTNKANAKRNRYSAA